MGGGARRGRLMATLPDRAFPGAPFRLGLATAVAAAAVDQAVKMWLLYGFGLTPKSHVAVTPFLDLVLAWNTGISYSLFQLPGLVWQVVLLALTTVAVVVLLTWLARTSSYISGISIGLIVGGAIGNGVDRVMHGAVMDFVLFHLAGATWTFQWYVFNLADAAIVAGVIGLVCESLFLPDAAKVP
jgi:signal peptidase II